MMAKSNAYYYENGTPLGSHGDFITSPEISQLFGECVALWCLLQSERCGVKNPHILELGPGKGTLMRDMVHVFRTQPSFNPVLHLVEASAPLQKHQYEVLKNCGYSFYQHTDFPRIEVPILIIANEFFDALPMQQYVWQDNLWHMVYITLEDGCYGYTLVPISDIHSTAYSFLPENPISHVVFEYSEATLNYAHVLAKSLKKNGGAALIIDYGDFTPEKRFGNTFQALYRHKYVDPLTHFFKGDLTYHVDFARMADIFSHHGHMCHFSFQKDFLKANGFDMRFIQLLKAYDSTQKEDFISRAERLIHPKQMGTLFKVLEVVGNI